MEIKVTSTLDTGVGTLRQAILDATINPLTIITFIPCIEKICLTTQLTIASNIKILASKKVTLTVNQGRHFNIVAGTMLKLKNLILKNGKTNDCIQGGGAILVNTSTNHDLIIENCLLKNNNAIYGGAILTNNNLIMLGSKVTKNSAILQGGGCWIGKNATLTDSYITFNKVTAINNSTFGGGLNIDNGNLFMNKSKISHNCVNFCLEQSIGGTAGGVNVTSGNMILTKSKIDFNLAYNSGGIKIGTGNINVLDKSSICENKSFISGDNVGGGGITIINGNVIIDDSKICRNITRGMYSGGIVSFLGNVTVNSSNISKNVNRGPGGGIACNFNCCLSISNSKICWNTGSSIGAAIVNFSNTTGQVYVTNSNISNNKLTNYQTLGQSIAAFLTVIANLNAQTTTMTTSSPSNISSPTPGSILVLSILPLITKLANITYSFLLKLNLSLEIAILTGGTITTLLKCPININNTKIENNYITQRVDDATNPIIIGYGGAIFSCNSEVVINSSSLQQNKVITGATAIYNNANLVTNNCNIQSNQVDNNSVPLPNVNSNGNGTLLNSKEGLAILVNTQIINNQVKDYGGGIYNDGILTLVNDEITYNKARCDGGGIYSSARFTTCNSIITNNKPNDIEIKMV